MSRGQSLNVHIFEPELACAVDLEGLECYEDPDDSLDPLKPPGDDCYTFYPEDVDGPGDIPSHIDVQVCLLCRSC